MRSSERRRSVSKDICRPIADLTREELEQELEQIREALVLERQKRQSLEQQILLEGCEKAGSSLCVAVSLFLAARKRVKAS